MELTLTTVPLTDIHLPNNGAFMFLNTVIGSIPYNLSIQSCDSHVILHYLIWYLSVVILTAAFSSSSSASFSSPSFTEMPRVLSKTLRT